MLASLLLALALSSPAPTDRIVVTPLTAQRNVDEGLVTLLGEVMLSELQRRGQTVVGYSDIQAMLDNEAAKSMLACDGTNCLAELGDAMGARYLIHSSLGRIGAQYVLNLKLIDVGTSSVSHRVTKQISSADEGALIEAVKVAVVELMSGSASAEELPPVATGGVGGGGGVLPAVVGVSGVALAVGGVAVGATFGFLAHSELRFAPIDARYAASVKTANDNAGISTIGWVVGGVGVVVAGVGATLMFLEE